MKIPVIETKHIRLRPFNQADVEALFKIANQRDIFRYFPNPAAWTREKTEKFIENQLAHWEQHGFGWWAVEPRGRPEVIGWNGLQYLPETEEIEVGYLISQSFQGRGWTTEGVRASLGFGFDTLGIRSIVAIIHPENVPSQCVAVKCGMSFVDRNKYFGMECYRYRAQKGRSLS